MSHSVHPPTRTEVFRRQASQVLKETNFTVLLTHGQTYTRKVFRSRSVGPAVVGLCRGNLTVYGHKASKHGFLQPINSSRH
ncbi:hypothetical protein Hamer_G019965 [Homarus americanus]|uniref:Uncharacterized protein n=1 Tax=Homarus americanus TaxID=6706 RepID=A0A8J5J8H2_HOMAM|nr:hypothetical protein Hamer_G019965 [Homarus americanus]